MLMRIHIFYHMRSMFVVQHHVIYLVFHQQWYLIVFFVHVYN